MFGSTLYLLTYPTVSDRGRPVPNYEGTPTEVAIRGVDLQPGASTELIAQRSDATEIRWTAIVPAVNMPPAATITEDSIVRVPGGEVCQVQGKPLAWLDDGPLNHYVVYLSEWSP